MNPDIASIPDPRPPLIEGRNRSEQSLVPIVANRREGELDAAYDDAIALARLSQRTGMQTLSQMGVQTFNSRPDTVAPSPAETSNDHIDTVAASNEANNQARPSGEVFENIISSEFGPTA